MSSTISTCVGVAPTLQQQQVRRAQRDAAGGLRVTCPELGKGGVDVALRSGDTDDGELVGRTIGESQWALYASRPYVARHGARSGVAQLAHPHAAGASSHAADGGVLRLVIDEIDSLRPIIAG
ncbi:MAG TPA: hypothetical protein VML58_22605 [Burkholderiaceae bacterium]|nr:hypothetical protein [Burkholderiaceae bacterium]